MNFKLGVSQSFQFCMYGTLDDDFDFAVIRIS